MFISNDGIFFVYLKLIFALLFKRSRMFDYNNLADMSLDISLFFCDLVLNDVGYHFYCYFCLLSLAFIVVVYFIYISYLTLCLCFSGDVCNWKN